MIGLFVDGSHMRKALASVGAAADYRALRPFISEALRDDIAAAYWFDARHPDVNDDRRNAALLSAGFRIQTHYRVAHEYVRDQDGAIVRDRNGAPVTLARQKGVDVGLALAIERSYRTDGWNRLVLAAGDADFAELVAHLAQHEGVRVTLLSDEKSLSLALRPWAERIIGVAEIPMTVRRLQSA